MYRLPRISSRVPSDSLGGAGGAAVAASTGALLFGSAAFVVRNAGANTLVFATAGTSGLAAPPARTAAVFSRLAVAGSGTFSLTSVLGGASAPAPAVGSAFAASLPDLAEGALF